jgi:hypothetical protein
VSKVLRVHRNSSVEKAQLFTLRTYAVRHSLRYRRHGASGTVAFDNIVPEMRATDTEPSLLFSNNHGTPGRQSVVDPQAAVDYEEPFEPFHSTGRIWQN